MSDLCANVQFDFAIDAFKQIDDALTSQMRAKFGDSFTLHESAVIWFDDKLVQKSLLGFYTFLDDAEGNTIGACIDIQWPGWDVAKLVNKLFKLKYPSVTTNERPKDCGKHSLIEQSE